jgi:L-arabinose isomerase
MPIDEWCSAWLLAGATHHMGGARGRWTPQLLALAKMLGVEAVVV